jgi:nicotinate-nucleotide adenylyltransferase
LSDPNSPARLGIFGGTFDPPHTGHLLAAMDAAEVLGLDRVWFVPNAIQPLKGAGQVSARDRLEMVRRMVGDDPRFGVESLEIDRAGASYTVDTVAVFAERFPASIRFLLVGADVTGSFDKWRDPGRIRELAEVVIMRRAADGPGGEAGTGHGAGSRWLAGARWLETRRIDISSTEIRERVRTGRSIRGFVPDAVAEYIAAAGLYR